MPHTQAKPFPTLLSLMPRSQLMDYNENFRLFMVTRNPNPELPPDASALVCEVNFTITRYVQSWKKITV